MLDQAEVPGGGFDHLLEQSEPVVERKARETDFSLLLELHDPVDQFERDHLLLPAPVHDHVDVVEVDHVGSDRPAGLVEKFLEILRPLHDPPRRLGSHVDPVAPVPLESFSCNRFALSAEVDPAGVDVVHAAFDCATDHGDALRRVHGLAVCEHRQPQEAEAERGDIDAGAPHRAILHLGIEIQNRTLGGYGGTLRRFQNRSFAEHRSGGGHQRR